MGRNRFKSLFLGYCLILQLFGFFSVTCLVTGTSATTASTSTPAASFALLMRLLMDQLILVGEVIFEIDTLFVLQNLTLLFYDLLPTETFLIIISTFEAKKCSCVNSRSLGTTSVMHDLKVSLYFILCLEGYIALWLTLVVWTNIVWLWEMTL